MKKGFTKIKRLKLLIVLMLIVNFGFSQGPWVDVYSENNQFIRDMCFVAGSDGLWQTGWAINFEGDVLKTTNGGDTWTTYEQNLSVMLGGITFVDEYTGYIATLDDLILKSTDGGETWSISYTSDSGFDKPAFKDANNGCVVGGQRLYTTDGGSNWTGSSGGSNYWDLDHATGDNYYGVYLGGDLGHSSDGGQTWSNVESLGVFAGMVDFYDGYHGMFGGDVSKIKVTHDKGDTWTTSTLGTGQGFLVCGAFYDPDTLYATGSPADLSKSTDGGLTWVTDTSFTNYSFRAMVVTPHNVLYLCGEKTTTGEGVIFKKVGISPLQANFEADEDTICVGSSVNFTDLSVGVITSWEWTFDGGTPSSSTDQNPTVTYNSTGSYDVELTVTDEFGENTKIRTSYINVLDVPGQAGIPEGDEEICTINEYEYAVEKVEFAQEYEWEVDPVEAGTITWSDTAAVLLTNETWFGDFSIKVRALNICGEGDWSDDFEGTIFLSPSFFTVEGGGSFCLGGDGVEITLSGSEEGVDYELYLDGESIDIVVSGTGEEISFGLLDEDGYYSAVGYTDYCLTLMNEQVSVTTDFPPTEPATPTGPIEVCNDEVSEYESEGVEGAESYTWTLSPDEAGVITFDELQATVEWSSSFSGIGYISLFGINECGDGNTSAEIEVMVDAIPEPVISGEELVCDNHTEEYMVEENEGNNYSWEVTGGTIASGQDSSIVIINWGEPGEGLLNLIETSPNGCVGDTADFEVLIDDCTDVVETKFNNLLKIYPNPSSDLINIEFMSKTQTSSRLIIFNQLGQVMLEKELKMGESKRIYQINIDQFQNGMYIIRIANTDGEMVTKQFVKK